MPSLSSYRKRAGIFTLLVLSLASVGTRAMEVASSPEEMGLATWRLDQITQELQQLVNDDIVPGAAFIVLRGGKYVYHGEVGYSDRETMTGFRSNSICRLLSMSKPVAAVAIMKLIEDGKLAMDDPLSKYLPEWKDMRVVNPNKGYDGWNADGTPYSEPAHRQITIFDLLTHTSGMSYGYGFGNASMVDSLYPANWRVPMMRMDEFSRTIAKVPLLSEPGDRWRYSYSYDVLGVVLMKVTGISPDVWMHNHIFKPLGMTDTAFSVPMSKINRYSTSYAAMSNGRLQFIFRPRFDYVSYAPPTFKSLGGGIVSTAKDFARFGQMLLNGGTLDGVSILSSESVDAMWRNYLPASHLPMDLNGWASDPNTGYGLGFTIAVNHPVLEIENWDEYKGDKRTGSIGWGGGAQTNFALNADDDTAIIYMSQKIGGPDVAFQGVVVKGVNEAIQGPSPRVQAGGFSTYTGVPSEQEKTFGHNAASSLMEVYWN